MNRSEFSFTVRMFCACVALATFGCGLRAGAQAPSTTTATKTPAQTAAEARAQAAAQARANAAQARENAAQARAAARAAKLQQKQTASNTARTSTLPTRTTQANALPASTLPGAAGGSSALPATAARNRSAQAPGNIGNGTVGSGTLAWAARVYTSTGCVHNGNSAVCTFSFVNQGNEASLVAGGELAGIQLVDDAHVPHRASAAHFMDKYGTQQPRLVVATGDTGTYVVVFSDVNPGVSSAEFHLRTQVVGGITFTAASSPMTSAASAPSRLHLEAAF